MPREAQRGPERPERPRDAQRGSFLFCHRVHICQDWAPPVATLLHTHVLHLILSHHFSGRRLFRLSFLFCHKTCIFCFHFISLRHFSGHRLWRLSFLCLGHRQWRPLYVHNFILCHRIISLGAASVFCPIIEDMFIKFGHRQWRSFYIHTHMI